MRVAILDYTVGNLGSLSAALKRLGAEPYITKGEGLEDADAVILPGVGSFGAAAELAKAAVGRLARPTLGICLGMQLLFEESEESPGHRGLGLFRGRVVRIEADRVPHIGWELTEANGVCPIVQSGYYYYLHSYGVEATGAPHEGAFIKLRRKYVAAVCKGDIYGVQFHPERSGRAGLAVLKAFLELARR
ncbi:MAG: imidazole glycerol phosphate synthase subunit HisH [Thermoproteus sp. AZ2]|jgi:glutamine amidotransferase|uniref:Imidazole glycerol phosphate synthase subunit HisH n=1 Tax=Thermoproteus sp. AZ2 TaxID=1609232 RepID=A0ACC6UYK7_9CREN